ncbi:quinone oxidoreductase family protein [Mesorhizobium neociceri]|uniref:Zinc-binding alcohol dehydrogenase family protein n=1 Tax=Mesorhizobium neociceri TaxID=1307853 RepID=A0A838B776_9HYPH|nr:zinc-binding alcohol dehydrogenase family protein [Mesorhizobium neociceri]MBA1142295.1 zinc-binding alcohol dehydrogenase family protein [Mesorhizobium neociceri]
MRAMRADRFSGYHDLKLADIPKPIPSEGRLLVRMRAAGVTPLDHTILSGQFPRSTAPLVLGNEGAGVIEGGDADFPDGTRVAFLGPFGVFENGTYSDYVAVPKELLLRVPDAIDDTAAASLPVAYLTAYIALMNAGFAAGKVVLAPAIGGSVGNAVTQLARALGAGHSISSTTSHAKAKEAKALGFSEVIDLTDEGLADGVKRLSEGHGADIVIDGIGGKILSAALSALAPGASVVTLGYSAGRESTINVTDLIWKAASIKGFLLLTESASAWQAAWSVISDLLVSGKVKPVVAKVLALEDAAKGLRYLIEERPFGRVVLKI